MMTTDKKKMRSAVEMSGAAQAALAAPVGPPVKRSDS